MSTRHSSHPVVRITPRASGAPGNKTLEQQISKTQTDLYWHIDQLLGHISGLKRRVEQLERGRR